MDERGRRARPTSVARTTRGRGARSDASARRAGGSSARSRAHHLRRPEPRGARARTATRGRETSPNGSQKTRGPSNARGRQARAGRSSSAKTSARGVLLLGVRPRSRPTSRGARPAAMFARRPPPRGDASDDSSDVFTDSEPDERGAGPPPSRARPRETPLRERHDPRPASFDRFGDAEAVPSPLFAPSPPRSAGPAAPPRYSSEDEELGARPASRRAGPRGFEPGASGSGSRRAPEGEGPHHRRPAQPPPRPPSSELLARTLGIPPGSVGERDDRDRPGFLDAEDASSPLRGGGGGGRTVGASARRSRRGRDAAPAPAPAPAPPPASESRRARVARLNAVVKSGGDDADEIPPRKQRSSAFFASLDLRALGSTDRWAAGAGGGEAATFLDRLRARAADPRHAATWLVGLAALQFLGGFLAALWESGTQYAAPPHALPVASWGLACAAMDAFEDASDASGAGRGRTLFSSSRGGVFFFARERRRVARDGASRVVPRGFRSASPGRGARAGDALLRAGVRAGAGRGRDRAHGRGVGVEGEPVAVRRQPKGGARGDVDRARRKGTRRALRVGARGEGDREAQSGGGGEGARGGREGLGGGGVGRRAVEVETRERNELAARVNNVRRRAGGAAAEQMICSTLSSYPRRALHSVARLRALHFAPARSRSRCARAGFPGARRGATGSRSARPGRRARARGRIARRRGGRVASQTRSRSSPRSSSP